MAATKVLLTGATGYIGGSVLTTLLKSSNPQIKAIQISALVRKQEHVDVLKTKGVNAILFSGLEDTEVLRREASEHDIVINTASAFTFGAAEALIDGLADRKKSTGKETHLIHTSGTSSLGDRPLTKTYKETRVFSDEDDIYAYERSREDDQVYAQRTTDLVVFEKGEAANIKTYILMSPTIYGIGSGFFNQTSIQIDAIIRAARRTGFTLVLGSGVEEWDHVHIEDLAELYELFLVAVLEGKDLPSNKQGLYFNETGHQSWREVSELVAKAGKELGYLKTDEVREVSLEEGASILNENWKTATVELGFASRSRTKADKARKIGWQPKKTRQDFVDSFVKEWKVVGTEAI